MLEINVFAGSQRLIFVNALDAWEVGFLCHSADLSKSNIDVLTVTRFPLFLAYLLFLAVFLFFLLLATMTLCDECHAVTKEYPLALSSGENIKII